MGFCIWLSGLPGSGKSTIANRLKLYFLQKGLNSSILDGDTIRKFLNDDLGFSKADRKKNVFRVGYIAKLIVESGGICIVSLVSPYKDDRSESYKLIGNEKVLSIILCGNPGNKKYWPNSIYEIGKEIIIDTNKTHIDECLKIIIFELERRLLNVDVLCI